MRIGVALAPARWYQRMASPSPAGTPRPRSCSKPSVDGAPAWPWAAARPYALAAAAAAAAAAACLVLRQPLPSLGHKKNNRLLDVHSKDVHAVDQPFWHAGRGSNQLEQQRARFSYLVLLRSVDSGNECRPRAV